MKSTTVIRGLAVGVGVFVIGLGVICVVSPSVFFRMVAFMQDPPAIWLAAVVRITVGAVLLLAAAASRTPLLFRILGGLILVGGIATLFVGQQMGHAMLDQWAAGGENFIRVSGGGAALAIGLFIVWSSAKRSSSKAATEVE